MVRLWLNWARVATYRKQRSPGYDDVSHSAANFMFLFVLYFLTPKCLLLFLLLTLHFFTSSFSSSSYYFVLLKFALFLWIFRLKFWPHHFFHAISQINQILLMSNLLMIWIKAIWIGEPLCGLFSTAGKALAFHTADLSLIPGTTYGSLSTVRSELWAQNQD